jgi:HEPN domain-containing protein
MDPVIKNWLDLSKYDYVTAKAMLNSRRYLYVAFTCQQSIEKMLKAIFCTKKNETPPYTHNLIKMADAAEVTNLT